MVEPKKLSVIVVLSEVFIDRTRSSKVADGKIYLKRPRKNVKPLHLRKEKRLRGCRWNWDCWPWTSGIFMLSVGLISILCRKEAPELRTRGGVCTNNGWEWSCRYEKSEQFKQIQRICVKVLKTDWEISDDGEHYGLSGLQKTSGCKLLETHRLPNENENGF